MHPIPTWEGGGGGVCPLNLNSRDGDVIFVHRVYLVDLARPTVPRVGYIRPSHLVEKKGSMGI
jgi:hypothetical protein